MWPQFTCWQKIAIWSVIVILPGSAIAQEYFGNFPDALDGSFVEADPRPVFLLGKPFVFKDPNGLEWDVPAGEKVDGASIPQIFWSFIGGPFDGNYIKASVIHDFYCRAKERTAHDTHRDFYYGMRAGGVSESQAKLMYWAVDAFGPNWKIERRITQALACHSENGIECTSNPIVKTQTVVSEPLDLEDPQVRALALSKFLSVAKTLNTTAGGTLDVGPYGEVSASLESIDTNASQFRTALFTEAYKTRPADLGLLTDTTAVGPLNELLVWPGNTLPKFESSPGLQEAGSSSAFQLKPGELKLLEEKTDIGQTHFKTSVNPNYFR